MSSGAPPLAAHLRRELGAWPPPQGFTVTTTAERAKPGWDGRLRPVMGVATPAGTVVAVREDMFPSARGARSAEELGAALGGRIAAAIFRWSDAPTPLEPLGEWRPVTDPAVPEWLHPFGGEVLVELDESGGYVGGVGLKRHDDDVWEISVGTEEVARGKGIARRLVTTAARAVIDAGRTPTYLHDPANTASAKVAEASGFPERDWRMLFFVPSRSTSDR